VPFFRLCQITSSITEEIFILNKLVRRFKYIAVLYCVLLKNSIKNANKIIAGVSDIQVRAEALALCVMITVQRDAN